MPGNEEERRDPEAYCEKARASEGDFEGLSNDGAGRARLPLSQLLRVIEDGREARPPQADSNPPLYPLSYGARDECSLGRSGLRRRLELGLGRLAAAQLPATFGLRVHLGAQQERKRREPEPREHDDHRGERSPRLVVGGEKAHVEREEPGGDKPDGDRDDRTRREEAPARVVDVRAE